MSNIELLTTCEYRLARDDDTSRIEQLLRGTQEKDPDAPGRLYRFFAKKMQTFKENKLYLASSDASESSAFELDWAHLESDLLAAAERMWRSEFCQDTSIEAARKRLRGRRGVGGRLRDNESLAQRRRLEELMIYVRYLLWLWVEAHCYHERMMSNLAFYSPGIHTSDTRQRDVHDVDADMLISQDSAAQVRDILREYHHIIKKWDKQLSLVVDHSILRTQVDDAQRLKTLAKQIGPQDVSSDEPGWLSQAAAVASELRFQYFDALLREKIRVGQWIRASGLLLLKITTGYGARPYRFVITALSVLLAFWAMYFGIDYFVGSQCYPATFSLSSILQHLYLALTNLTSLGSNPPPCGGWTRAVSAVESVLGYFLLAVLAALFIELLTESER